MITRSGLLQSAAAGFGALARPLAANGPFEVDEQLTSAAAAKRKVSQDDAGLKIKLPEKTGYRAFVFKLV
jgi:hypothetical protein